MSGRPRRPGFDTQTIVRLTWRGMGSQSLRGNSLCPPLSQCHSLHHSSPMMFLSNGPCKKDSTRGNGMRKGANFCTTLLLFYHTSDWLNQQNLPKLQVAVYLFILNWSTIFLSTKSLPSINTAVILCEEHWKIRGFYCLCLRLLWLVEMFPHKGNYLPKKSLNTFFFINLLSIG